MNVWTDWPTYYGPYQIKDSWNSPAYSAEIQPCSNKGVTGFEIWIDAETVIHITNVTSRLYKTLVPCTREDLT